MDETLARVEPAEASPCERQILTVGNVELALTARRNGRGEGGDLPRKSASLYDQGAPRCKRGLQQLVNTVGSMPTAGSIYSLATSRKPNHTPVNSI